MPDHHGDPHQVLGVSPGAPDEEIKRAFRQLAKQLHPDLHPGDASAERRFREVVSAYQVLTGSEPASAVPVQRPTLWAQTITMAAVFLMTVVSVGIAALWWAPGGAPRVAPAPAASHSPTAVAPSPISLASAPPEEAGKARPKPLETGQTEKEKAAFDSEARPAPDHGSRQSSTPGSESMPASDVAQVLTEQGRDREEARVEDPRKLPIEAGRGEVTPSTQPGAAKGAASLAPGSAHKWADVRNPRFGFSLAYPTDLLVEGPERSNQGTVFHTRDGRASLSISAATTALTLAAHWRSLVDGPYRGAAFDYTPRRAYWFVLSGTLAGSIFYQRVTLSCDRRMVHSWKLVYPAAERDVFDPVVEEIHRRYTHSNGAGARCGEVGR